MPKSPRWTATEANVLSQPRDSAISGRKAAIAFTEKGGLRVTVPFHSGAILQPKIVKQVLEVIDEAARSAATEQCRRRFAPERPASSRILKMDLLVSRLFTRAAVARTPPADRGAWRRHRNPAVVQ